MKNECIIFGIVAMIFAIPPIWCLIKIVRGRYDSGEDFDLLIMGLLGIMYCFVFGLQLYIHINWLLSPPIITSCIPVVTQENDTLYEFHDSTRFCKGQIEEDEISTTFTITKENATDGLSGTDTCNICDRPLCEHWKSQTRGQVDIYVDLPAW